MRRAPHDHRPAGTDRGSERVETYVTLPHISGESGQDKGDGVNSNETLLISSLPIFTPQVTNPIPIKNTTPKPRVPAPPPTTTTTSTTTTTTTTTTPTTTTTTTTTPAPIATDPVEIIPAASGSKSPVEGAIEGSGENQTVAEAETTDMPDSQKGHEDGSGIGGGSVDIPYTTLQTFNGMMSNLMSKHEWWTLAILAVVAALALAAVVSAVTWIIYNRIASRRRRTNLEKVITDLQSKDKVVLLNSEDSEDEA
ncbi:cell wall integrity and stress response component 4-like [Portunus trituberculatus]|uniref:cell wall integrity and stress response component 4-like n=1 Tax=Portunus trituberculatus TaxID=210409 RepID=UPI001E1CB341|nr:cell wall integrity and stress response component 4-like [Portunus trituberculatus]